jgi:hypothetical protein
MSDQPAVEAVDPQAIVKPLEIKPLDIQHDTDPADDHGLARRIPHLGHTVLFFSLALFFVSLGCDTSRSSRPRPTSPPST